MINASASSFGVLTNKAPGHSRRGLRFRVLRSSTVIIGIPIQKASTAAVVIAPAKAISFSDNNSPIGSLLIANLSVGYLEGLIG